MMQIEITWRTIMFAMVVIGWLLATHWADRVRHLRLTFFRPWRGDPWPQGVQEEDDVRWRWNRPRTSPKPNDAAPTDHVGSIHIGRPNHRS
jgi:hypothetical protein